MRAAEELLSRRPIDALHYMNTKDIIEAREAARETSYSGASIRNNEASVAFTPNGQSTSTNNHYAPNQTVAFNNNSTAAVATKPPNTDELLKKYAMTPNSSLYSNNVAAPAVVAAQKSVTVSQQSQFSTTAVTTYYDDVEYDDSDNNAASAYDNAINYSIFELANTENMQSPPPPPPPLVITPISLTANGVGNVNTNGDNDLISAIQHQRNWWIQHCTTFQQLVLVRGTWLLHIEYPSLQ